MANRSICSSLCLSLFAYLWTSGAATADPVLVNGEVGLTLSSSLVSAFPLDEAALAEHLCNVAGPAGHLVKCKVTVRNNQKEVVLADPVVTPCGVWDSSVTFDLPSVEPGSSMALTEVTEDPGRGVFTGAFDMNTNLHLTNRETGQTADFSLSLGFNLAGPYVLAAPDAPPTPDNLFLLTDRGEDGNVFFFDICVPVDFQDEHPRGTYDIEGHECRLCLRAFSIEPLVINSEDDDRESTVFPH